jgi:thymidylate synthase (FAD)
MRIAVLDRGYVELIEPWGTGRDGADALVARDQHDPEHTYVHMCNDYEVGIIEAARQSTQGSFRGWEQDAKLLRFLHDKKHSTPFEFAGLVIEVQAPIFVFREWHRHRTQAYSEMSARYSPLPDGEYVPTMERLMQVNTKDANKQAGNVGGIELSAENAQRWLAMLDHAYAVSAEAYRFALSVGVAKELARCPMPLAQYTRMRAVTSLRNWLAFLTLRMDPNAQWEIRQFANAVGQVIAAKFPQTWKLFDGSRAVSA